VLWCCRAGAAEDQNHGEVQNSTSTTSTSTSTATGTVLVLGSSTSSSAVAVLVLLYCTVLVPGTSTGTSTGTCNESNDGLDGSHGTGSDGTGNQYYCTDSTSTVPVVTVVPARLQVRSCSLHHQCCGSTGSYG
jgi:hypothetical protein